MGLQNPVSDQIEESLKHIEAKLLEAWRGNRCQTCPLGELAALAAATKTFYVENRGRGNGTVRAAGEN